MKILYLTNLPSPYIVDFLNELGKYCDLTAIFERGSAKDRDISWKNYRFQNFSGYILSGLSVGADMAICPQIVIYLKKSRYDHILVANPCTPTGIIAIAYMKLMRIPYMIESEGGFAKNGKGIKERFKKQIMSNAKLYFSTTEVGDEYFLMYGAQNKRIVRYPFTSLYDDDLLQRVLLLEEKDRFKRALGIKKGKMVLSVGRIIYSKGYDILLNACKYLDDSAEIYIIGGVATQEYLDLISNLNLKNVHFVGYKSTEELKEYYKAADLFVLPTREDTWGLVINEAMAHGLPVITTNRCVAGLALIKDYDNGFIVPVGDYQILATKINLILLDDRLRAEMAQNNINKIQGYTFETMARTHMKIFKEYENKPRETLN